MKVYLKKSSISVCYKSISVYPLLFLFIFIPFKSPIKNFLTISRICLLKHRSHHSLNVCRSVGSDIINFTNFQNNALDPPTLANFAIFSTGFLYDIVKSRLFEFDPLLSIQRDRQLRFTPNLHPNK